MLDTDTKRRIDTARDILVGKVPDPKSQVEQITIGLIYKFMDDLDADSEELGGERKFFADEFARYGWSKLTGPGIGGYEMLNLYAEAITRMPENPGIPPLFRDIFNNAYLPYRDPETLRAFLKIIDGFTYDHSERLGDAFEYLLSILGAQGDAGQFRTPRHIIDFIVAVIDPKKDDVILDPACGTAGFLISAYKHILRANTNSEGQSTLTPHDRGRLVDNFKGYDISPDMVRLSLVNMYLHGFREPHIHEYDTLTSEERWNEYADVILANPPFMSPRGGIRPHNRFSVQSTRSEVLFVDYMAEHLTPTGRAGIIVPEGIVFQSQAAYKQLRKMLVDDYLVAVVSLPSGVFNPYSGVKTSILVLDRALAKRTDAIAFFKVENDGFDLGAQRRPIERSDLPQVQIELAEYMGRLPTGNTLDAFRPTLGQVVLKEHVAADGEYSLSGERYRESGAKIASWPTVSVKDLFRRSDDTVLPETLSGSATYVGLENITQGTGQLCGNVVIEDPSQVKSLKSVFRTNDILYGRLRPNLNKVWLADRNGFCSTDILVIQSIAEKVLPELYAYLFRSSAFNSAVLRRVTGAQLPRISWAQFQNLTISLPPLGIQAEIVAELESYQKIIDGARVVVDNYRPHIVVDPEWPLVSIGELANPQYGFTASAQDRGDTRFVRITDITEGGFLSDKEEKFITLTSQSAGSLLERGDILVARTGATYGKTMLFDEDYPAVFASYLIRLRFPPERVDPYFCWAFAQSDNYWNQARALMTGGGQPQFNGNAIKQVKLPLPPLTTQLAIAAELKAEQAIVESNQNLIQRFEHKIQSAVARVWGSSGSVTTDT